MSRSLDLHPEIAVVTNIEGDHWDHHGTEDHLRASFVQFLSQIRPNGRAAWATDRTELHALQPRYDVVLWYGTEVGADVRGSDLSAEGLGGKCRLWLEGPGGRPGEGRVGAPGSVTPSSTCLGALAAARLAGASLKAWTRRARGGLSRGSETLRGVRGLGVGNAER